MGCSLQFLSSLKMPTVVNEKSSYLNLFILASEILTDSFQLFSLWTKLLKLDFPFLMFIMQCKVILESVNEILECDQILRVLFSHSFSNFRARLPLLSGSLEQATEQFVPVVLFVMLDKILSLWIIFLTCYYSIESYWATVLSCDVHPHIRRKVHTQTTFRSHIKHKVRTIFGQCICHDIFIFRSRPRQKHWKVFLYLFP